MNRKTNVLILGAGVGGLAAAAWCKNYGLDFILVDKEKSIPRNLHNGVHYLHSIPELPFEMPIRKITLTDGVLMNHGVISDHASLNAALEYSEKVRDIQHPSSIMNVGKETEAYMPESGNLDKLIDGFVEYIPTDNFIFLYHLDSIGQQNKVVYFTNSDYKKEFAIEYEHIISTIPLGVLCKAMLIDTPELNSNPIYVSNYKVNGIVPNWLINLYVPSLRYPMYRASLLNGVCSVESIRPLTEVELNVVVKDTLSMFHIGELIEKYTWETGKVVSISIQEREKIVDELHEMSIYSIGRFGLHNRKLLVDSTINQAYHVASSFTGLGIRWPELRTLLTN